MNMSIKEHEAQLKIAVQNKYLLINWDLELITVIKNKLLRFNGCVKNSSTFILNLQEYQQQPIYDYYHLS